MLNFCKADIMKKYLYGLRNGHSARFASKAGGKINLATVEGWDEGCTRTLGAIVVNDKCSAPCRSIESTCL